MPIGPELAKHLADVASALPPFSMPASPGARGTRMEAVARRLPSARHYAARRDRRLHVPGRELRVRAVLRPGAKRNAGLRPGRG